MELLCLPRVALVLSIGLLASHLAGCAADARTTPADDGTAVDAISASNLRAATSIKGTVIAGTAATLAYDRDDASYVPTGVPYLALEIVAAPVVTPPADPVPGDGFSGNVYTRTGDALGGQSITVNGDFPGRPRVLIVDESFKQVASATAHTLPDGTAEATVVAPRGVGKRFVLVHDTRWSLPMSFQVSVGQ